MKRKFKCESKQALAEKLTLLFASIDFFDNVCVSLADVGHGSGLAVLPPVGLLPLLRVLHHLQLVLGVHDVLRHVTVAGDSLHLETRQQKASDSRPGP